MHSTAVKMCCSCSGREWIEHCFHLKRRRRRQQQQKQQPTQNRAHERNDVKLNSYNRQAFVH